MRAKGALLTAICLALTGVARAEDWSPWQRAYDPATRMRNALGRHAGDPHGARGAPVRAARR
jgi:hypothetical protein